MSLSASYGFPDPHIQNEGEPRPLSRMERAYAVLTVTSDVVHIVYWVTVGGFLILLPWLQFWDHNFFLFRWPGLRPILGSPFVKGAILGLGIVNLLIGLQEFVQFRKPHGLSR